VGIELNSKEIVLWILWKVIG